MWVKLRTTPKQRAAWYAKAEAKGVNFSELVQHMMFKLGQCAEESWRKLRGFDPLAKVITGVNFTDGIETTNNQAAA